MRLVLAVLATALLAACGGADRPSGEDEQLQRSLSAGRSAFVQGRSDLAITLYREARERALARDDPAAIAAASYNLGAAELQKGDAEAALEAARAGVEEVERRQAQGTAPLRLVEAAALYRLGRNREAAAAARAAASDDRAGPMVRARAIFVEGLIAAQSGDIATVQRALARLSAPDGQPELAADRAELTGWRAFLAGDLPQARRAFLEAADGRRLALDYRGMSRALAAAGDAAAQDGDVAAGADLFLRAGRSAKFRGEPEHAKLWLGRAEALASLARRPDVLDEARALNQDIAE